MTIVSYSELFSWDNCERQYYYSHVLDLRPTDQSAPIDTGGKGHKLLQAFYRGMQEGYTKEEALEATKHKAKDLMTVGKFTVKNLLTAWTLVDNYIRTTDFTATALLVENRFLLPANRLTDDPAFEGIEIGFTPDVVFERTGGWLDVEDSKFVGRAWSNTKINHFVQDRLYQIFLTQMGYKVSRSGIRFFNTETGKITVQTRPPLTKEAQTILIRDFLSGIKKMIEFKKLPLEKQQEARRVLNYTICQGCFFEYVCSLESEGKDASKSLKSLYTKSGYDYAN